MGETSQLLGLSASRLATHFSGSSWGSVGQGSVGRGLVRLARSGTGEKSRQPGGRRPMVLDSFSSDGSRECSKSIEEQVSPREQRRWSLLPFSPSTLRCLPPRGGSRPLVPPPYRDGSVSGPDTRKTTVGHSRSTAGRYDPPRRLSQVATLSFQWPTASNRTGLDAGGRW